MEIWSLVVAIASILVGVGGIVVALWVRNRKGLAYEVISNVPIVTVVHDANNAVTQALEIRYNGSPVRDVRMVVIRVWNSGNVPIVPGDYEDPITLSFGGQMLACDVIDSTPKSIQYKVFAGGGTGPDRSSWTFHPIMLNPGDCVTLQAILANFSDTISVDARIVGVSKIQEKLDTRRYTADLPLPVYVVLVAWVVIAVVSFIVRGNPVINWLNTTLVYLLGFSYALVILWGIGRRGWQYLQDRQAHQGRVPPRWHRD